MGEDLLLVSGDTDCLNSVLSAKGLDWLSLLGSGRSHSGRRHNLLGSRGSRSKKIRAGLSGVILEQRNYQLLEDYAKQKGASLFGVAFLDDRQAVRSQLSPQQWPPHMRFGISMGVRLSDAVIDSLVDSPTLLYAWHYRQANLFLDRLAFEISLYIQQEGYSALPIPASQIIDWKRQTAHLSHKHVGVLAGHGWIGRNNLLVNPYYGARVRYVTVLTDMPLRVDRPIEGDCGGCQQCIEPCPAQALGQSAAEYNFERCFKKLQEFRKRVGHYICGICVKACRGKALQVDQSISP